MHSLDRDAQGKVVFEKSITAEDRQAYIQDVQQNHPEIANAEQVIQEFRTELLTEMLVKTGLLKAEELALFNKMYPHYCPTFRVKDGASTTGRKTFSIQRAKGSTEQIYSPVDSFIEMVSGIVDLVSTNNVGVAFHEAMTSNDNMGVFGTRIDDDVKKTTIDGTELREKISKILEESEADTDVIENVLDTIGEEITQYRHTGNTTRDGTFAVQLDDGSRAYWQVKDPELFKLLTNDRTTGYRIGALADLTAGTSRLITGQLLFAVRNAARDYARSVNYGSWASNYLTALPKWVYSFFQAYKKNHSTDYQQYLAEGGGGWTRLDVRGKKSANEVKGELFEGYNTKNVGSTAKFAGKKLWQYITFGRLNEAVEQASRYAEYRFGKHDKSTDYGRQQAYIASQDASTDFTRRGNGELPAIMKSITPFYGATVEGSYQMARMFADPAERSRLPQRFTKYVINTALMTALSSFLINRYSDDDEKEAYMHISPDMRAGNVFLPNFAPSIFGEQPFIRIPLSQDPLSKAVNTVMQNALWSGEHDMFTLRIADMTKSILNDVNPVQSTIFDPVMDAKNNTTWYGGYLASPYMLESQPDKTLQYTAETPELFTTLSRWQDAAIDALGLDELDVEAFSPLELEYMAKQYTGFIGRYGIPALSKNKNTGEMEGVMAALNAARNQLTTDPNRSTDIVGDFYDGYEAMESVAQAGKDEMPMNMLRRSLTPEEAGLAYEEAYDMLHKGGILYDTKELIGGYYDAIDEINSRDGLAEDEKYELKKEQYQNIIEAALDAQEAMGEFKAKYVDDNDFLGGFASGVVAKIRTEWDKLPDYINKDEPVIQAVKSMWEENPEYSPFPAPTLSDAYKEVPDELKTEWEKAYYYGFTDKDGKVYPGYIGSFDATFSNATYDDQKKAASSAKSKGTAAAKAWWEEHK